MRAAIGLGDARLFSESADRIATPKTRGPHFYAQNVILSIKSPFICFNVDPMKSTQHPVSPLPLSEQALLRLRRGVLTCELMPGRKLKIEELQGAYGFSSSPLREALNRLSQEGLVIANVRRGFQVAPISRADLADITHMRLLLDIPALQASISMGDDAWEAAVVAAFHRLEKVESRLGEGPAILDDEWTALHREFHLALIAACPSDRHRANCATLFDQSERFRRYSARHRVIPRNKSRDHARLLDAALKRDVGTASTLLTAHIKQTLKNVDAALALLEKSSH
jgi:DNA-binding GntR family transcriptional regulator